MRYVPREPDAEVNVSGEHPLSEAATLVLGLSLIFALIAALLIFMVDAALYLVPALFSRLVKKDLGKAVLIEQTA